MNTIMMYVSKGTCINVSKFTEISNTYITPCQVYHWNLPCLALTVAVSFGHLWLWVCHHSQTCFETTTTSGSVSAKALIDTVHRTSWAMTTNAKVVNNRTQLLLQHGSNCILLIFGFWFLGSSVHWSSINLGLVILLACVYEWPRSLNHYNSWNQITQGDCTLYCICTHTCTFIIHTPSHTCIQSLIHIFTHLHKVLQTHRVTSPVHWPSTAPDMPTPPG